MPNEKNIFANFTGKYALSKTLRFELRPVGETLEKMREHFSYDKDMQTFFSDQKIEDAYQTLKPIVDKFHEEFITDSLQSQSAKSIDFPLYVRAREELIKIQKELKKIKNTKNDKEDSAKNKESIAKKMGKKIEILEKQYRAAIGESFTKTAANWKGEKYKNYKWKIGGKVASGAKVLSSPDLLKLIGDIKKDDQKIQAALKEFEGFFTYLTGFNQNRANYYETGKEASTAVATRIVHENLPKFSDNTTVFETRKDEYLGVYDILKQLGRELINRDNEPLTPIAADIFQETAFNSCLSQSEIERYNQKIGNANFLINLYNQAKKDEKGFTKLTSFKTLYKQIGCGKKKPLFFALTHEKKAEADAAQEKNSGKEIFSVEEILDLAKRAGESYLKSKSGNSQIETVPDFLAYIREKEIFDGVYWSKEAINTISNRYFADWTTLKEKLRNAKVFSKADKKSGEDVKIPRVIELEELFAVLGAVEDETWRDEGVFFKKGLTEKLTDEAKEQKNKKRRDIIANAKNPSQALLEFVLSDIEDHAQSFVNGAAELEKITQSYFPTAEKELEEKKKQWKEAIKKWIDYACNANAMLKYFLVNESKIKKGNPLDPNIANGLKSILFESKLKNEASNGDDIIVDWFKWRDALRNFLTKKPQDDAKENKLKLNFENPSLASGWDVNKEKDNYCIILQNNNGELFLAIVAKKHSTIFETKWTEGRGKHKIEKANPLYQIENTESWFKMEYNFWADASNMIPKCSTQLKPVIKHFKETENDFIFPVGYKVTSGEKFIQECSITKKNFELNNKVYNRSNVEESYMRYNLSNSQEKQYVKAFQKEYWELLLKKENTEKELSKEDMFIEWKKFCKKKPNELLEWEKKYKNALTVWINFCKYFLTKYPKTTLFEYSFKNSEEYNSIDEFYRDIDICSYKLKMDKPVNRSILDQLVKDGKVYLFQICNQDSNDGKAQNHKNNLHTIYWEALFKDIENRPKLSGGAEIFYRKALAPKDLRKKKVKSKDGNEKEVIENYRFSKEKFIFHVPIALNFCLANKDINDLVKKYFSEDQSVLFLGIDRGEKNLAYYSLVDQNGKLIKQGTLNIPFKDKNGKPRAVRAEKRSVGEDGKEKVENVECWNYNDLLGARAGDRDYARKNWQTIGTIKNLKDGYISQVVRAIADLAIQDSKPTYVVFESLNTGFKRSRQKIEKSVYQKLELALAKKLNFLVDKNVSLGEVKSVTHALQLTPPVNNYGDIKKKKQAGIILYTRPNYTSQTDPATGWRKSIYLKKGSEEYIRNQIIGNKEKKIMAAFSEICFDGKDYRFEYTAENTKKTWKLYSSYDGKGLDRFRTERNDKGIWEPKKQDLISILNDVFEKFDKTKSLLKQMKDGVELTKVKDERYQKYTAWESLRFAIDLIQQIRNSGTSDSDKRDSDFILSPVRDRDDGKGQHFDSRVYWDKEQKGEICDMPSSGDANGAFNIARKGIIMNEHIKRGFDLYINITDEEWDAWLAGEEVWKAWITENFETK